jgi:hypothetical protein
MGASTVGLVARNSAKSRAIKSGKSDFSKTGASGTDFVSCERAVHPFCTNADKWISGIVNFYVFDTFSFWIHIAVARVSVSAGFILLREKNKYPNSANVCQMRPQLPPSSSDCLLMSIKKQIP